MHIYKCVHFTYKIPSWIEIKDTDLHENIHALSLHKCTMCAPGAWCVGWPCAPPPHTHTLSQRQHTHPHTHPHTVHGMCPHDMHTHTLSQGQHTHPPTHLHTVHGVSGGSKGERGGGDARHKNRTPAIWTAQIRRGH